MRHRSLCLVGALVALAYIFPVAGESISPSTDGDMRTARTAVARSTPNQGRYIKKIDLVYPLLEGEHGKTLMNQQTPTPRGWEAYDGSAYTPERGYGWLINLYGYGRDRGVEREIVLANGSTASLKQLGRPELANFQGKHVESDLLVFRIDVPNGWYRVGCASVDPGLGQGKPLVDQRTFKCRAHDVVIAGANYGAPVLAGGRQLVEGRKVVEATEGHLRIVMGDPAYAGWIWSHQGPWNTGWRHWWDNDSKYAKGWLQVLMRKVDPGFHLLGLNSLEIERVPRPRATPPLVFRDFFNRDDSADINAGIAENKHWERVKLRPDLPDLHSASLYSTSIRLAGSPKRYSVAGLLQQQMSPGGGIIRYSTRVSLFTGAGSRRHSGVQEAGIVLLAAPVGPSEFNSTFLGVKFNGNSAGVKGALVYRVGDGRQAFRTEVEIPDSALPLRITEGEFELVVEHDTISNVLRRIQVNGIDLTKRWSVEDRKQRAVQGRFGLRSAIHNTNPHVNLQQFYWYYRVQQLG